MSRPLFKVRDQPPLAGFEPTFLEVPYKFYQIRL